ncbi:MAG: ABC transporter ATP-binding protein [Lachnospiraceae bacterium]|nr:ABC transporter ATP-binding protein [Lachnospiraceae bacterium]
MAEILSLDHLTKVYKGSDKPALDDITLTIGKGRIVGLLGPNGSGKTTLIKLINGLLTPTAGEIRVGGFAIGPESKAIVSYLPDRFCLPGDTSVKELIGFYRDFYSDFDTERAYGMLESLQIDPLSRIKTFSKGMKEKIQLILVMSRRAQLYVLDEPIAGVDPAARDYIIRTIIGNYQPDASVLLSTHLITDVENILDDVIFIKEGKVILSSPVEELRIAQGKSLDAYFREVFSC